MSTETAAAETLDLLTVGRVGVDIYPQQNGPLKDVSTFAKYLGGTATNVAVGAARLGRRTAVLTKVGPDPFGAFVREALVGFGVDPQFVGTAEGLNTPVVFCELDPPEDPGLFFYRQPIAPDLMITEDDIPWDRVRDVPIFWVTGTGASAEPSRTSQRAMLKHRGRPDRDVCGRVAEVLGERRHVLEWTVLLGIDVDADTTNGQQVERVRGRCVGAHQDPT